MKIQMARPVTQATAGGDTSLLRQHALTVIKLQQRTGVFGLAGLGIIAARHHQNPRVRRRDTHLMRIHTKVGR